ncbi:hypothetical protein HS141_15865 [Cetobacterium somerae]|uniref:hypothetical protein n=1 Tax=Cetobacterium somerae TaxID=188913 RepID=UPI00211DEABA|nr:hypothetical protein [Cetobacterium somerae]MCQ9628395.1 hypothetical protein [Cetobacterium somerae]
MLVVNGTIKTYLSYNKTPEIAKKRLVQILNFCNENKIEPTLVTTLVTYVYNELVTKDIYEERIYKHIDDVLSKIDFPVQYLDYSRYEPISNNLDYFFDADHLILTGVKKFTDTLLKNINVKLLEGENI